MKKSIRELCAWDSGSVIVLVMEPLMRTQAGIRCPAFTWKTYIPHRLKNSTFFNTFVLSDGYQVTEKVLFNKRSQGQFVIIKVVLIQT